MFFIVLGYTPIFLGLDVVPLGLVFTAWGVGLAFGILVVGHRLAHRIGAVQTVGLAIVVLLVTLVGLATSHSTAQSVVVLIVAGVCMGVCNANLTDLALATGSPDRRVTTGRVQPGPLGLRGAGPRGRRACWPSTSASRRRSGWPSACSPWASSRSSRPGT